MCGGGVPPVFVVSPRFPEFLEELAPPGVTGTVGIKGKCSEERFQEASWIHEMRETLLVNITQDHLAFSSGVAKWAACDRNTPHAYVVNPRWRSRASQAGAWRDNARTKASRQIFRIGLKYCSYSAENSVASGPEGSKMPPSRRSPTVGYTGEAHPTGDSGTNPVCYAIAPPAGRLRNPVFKNDVPSVHNAPFILSTNIFAEGTV